MKQTPKEYADELVFKYLPLARKGNLRDVTLENNTVDGNATRAAVICVERIIEAKPIRIDKSGLVLSNIDYYNQVLTELKTLIKEIRYETNTKRVCRGVGTNF